MQTQNAVSELLEHNTKILEAIRRKFSGANDVCVRHALQEVIDKTIRAQKRKIDETRVLCRIRSERAINAIIQYKCAEIESLAAQKRARLAQRKLAQAGRMIELAVDEFEGLDPDLQYTLDIDRLLVLKREDIKPAKRDLLKAARAMASQPNELLEAFLKSPELPEAIQPIADVLGEEGVRAVLTDLAEVLIEGGQKWRSRLIEILDDRKAAEAAAENEKFPPPIRFLAGIFLEVGDGTGDGGTPHHES